MHHFVSRPVWLFRRKFFVFFLIHLSSKVLCFIAATREPSPSVELMIFFFDNSRNWQYFEWASYIWSRKSFMCTPKPNFTAPGGLFLVIVLLVKGNSFPVKWGAEKLGRVPHTASAVKINRTWGSPASGLPGCGRGGRGVQDPARQWSHQSSKPLLRAAGTGPPPGCSQHQSAWQPLSPDLQKVKSK